MRRLISFGWMSVSLLWAATAAAQIGVSPPRSEVFLNEGTTTHTLRVYNFGDHDVEIAVSVRNWELDENNKVSLVEPTEQSLDQWMIVNPLKFHLAAGGSQAIRFSIRPKVTPEPGEHRAIMYFDELPGLNLDPNVQQIRFSLGSAIYAYAEPIERSAVLHGAILDGQSLKLDIESTGNAHVRATGQWAIWRTEAYPGPEKTSPFVGLEEGKATLPEGVVQAGMLPSTPILPGTRRMLVAALPSGLEPGDYVVDVDAAIENVDVQESFTLTIPPLPARDTPEPEPESTPSPPLDE